MQDLTREQVVRLLVSPLAFRRWLQQQQAAGVDEIGGRCDGYHCPLAAYLEQQLDDDQRAAYRSYAGGLIGFEVRISSARYRQRLRGAAGQPEMVDVLIATPRWAEQFINRIDSPAPGAGAGVPPEEALAILDRLEQENAPHV